VSGHERSRYERQPIKNNKLTSVFISFFSLYYNWSAPVVPGHIRHLQAVSFRLRAGLCGWCVRGPDADPEKAVMGRTCIASYTGFLEIHQPPMRDVPSQLAVTGPSPSTRRWISPRCITIVRLRCHAESMILQIRRKSHNCDCTSVRYDHIMG
jgi:hypothetical protein